jgi:DNA processing protein
VLAGGVERPTPRTNASVFEATVDHGAIVSEYPIGTKPRRFYFHRRNELIAALGDTTLVVRAAVESGTMITARAALALGRPLCALPGGLDDPLAQGCLELLVEGARCVRGAEDILERVLTGSVRPRQLTLGRRSAPPSDCASARSATPLNAHRSSNQRAPIQRAPIQRASLQQQKAREDLSEHGAELLGALCELAGPTREGVPLDQLKRHLDWPATQFNPALLELELTGAVAKLAGANIFRPR